MGWQPWIRLPPSASYRAELILYDPGRNVTLFVRTEATGVSREVPSATGALPLVSGFASLLAGGAAAMGIPL